jgi:NADPH-dependent 2,4-dienoyl-CoA reductase/sulfur reductase-like enzyme
MTFYGARRTSWVHSLSKKFFSVKSSSYQVVVAGGGSGGIAVAARLAEKLGPGKVAVIEPKDVHWYQPMWTLVGGGAKNFSQSERKQAEVTPKDATWVKEKVVEFNPDSNSVMLADGSELKYESLVVALGLELKLGKVPGLEELLHDPKSSVSSNYLATTCTKTFDLLKNFKGGRALFTHPSGQIKCAGAPQKIMYLVDEHLRKAKLRRKSEIFFYTATPAMFAVDKYRVAMEEVVRRKRIEVDYQQELVSLPANGTAVFKDLKGGESKTVSFDFMHATPPQGPFDIVKNSKLGDADGWVDVNKQTLQSTKYNNVWSLGDCSSIPTSKTAAAVAEQNSILVNNLLAKDKSDFLHYNGYTSCPLVTGYSSLVLAEFDFDKKPTETFIFDQSKERWSMYQLKSHVMPRIYWDFMVKGKWAGPAEFRKVLNPIGR